MIPAFKPGPALRETLESLLAQAPGPEQMQIEIVDDASPEGTGPEAVLADLGTGRVTVTRNASNLGLCGCWNRCIERARGQWVHLLHQDDLVLPGFYQNLRELIGTVPEAGAAFTRYSVIAEDGHWETISPVERRAPGMLENALERLYSVQRIQCPAIVVRREAYERLGGFSPRFPHALDWEMWVRIAGSFPVLYEPRFGACYRTHGESTSTAQKRSGENIRDVVRVVEYCRRYLPADTAGRIAKEALRFYAGTALDTALIAVWQRDFEMARAQLKGAIGCDASLATLARAAYIWVRYVEQKARFGGKTSSGGG
jgi:glycosyltransferase involved in cell wall biosynthesis